MAKDSDDTPRKKGKGSQIVVWALMAMLVVGLGGFGVTNFGGGLTSIGRVGDREIDTNTYARALQQELAALRAQFGQNITLSQAQSLGIDRQVLQSLVAQTALDNEAVRVRLSVGDAVVAQRITESPAFQGTAGRFDRDTYRFTLDRNNLTESAYEATLRADVARQLLTGAVAGGFVAPAPLTDTLYNWVGERRGFSMLRLTQDDLTAPIPAPDDAAVLAFYEANIASFTAPEAKRIRFAALLPDAIAADQPVDEDALRRMYDARLAEFVQPERRLVERLIYPSTEAASDARARVDAGEAFETLVAERGLDLDDIDLGDVAREDLGSAAEAVFALDAPGVVGPFDTDLGPALFRMNAILAAQEVSFDEARTDLAIEMQTDAARRLIAGQVDAIDDMLAGGSTLDEVAQDQGMVIETVDYVASVAAPEGIAGYPAFRAAADALSEGDFPEAVLLADGGVIAMEYVELVPAAPIPFEDARDDVLAAFVADATTKALGDRAIEVKSAVEGGASLGAFGIVQRTANIAREGFVEDAPSSLLTAVFAMAPGDLQVIEGPGFVGVVRLDEVRPAAQEGDDVAALKSSIAAQVEQALAQDALQLFSNALTDEAGIFLDQNAINAVHAQFN
ncbi:MAG: SurA N-terminal domain-containing protein [Pseudotabrizicola sp.]|uniref:peptidylprolyl isomerase n=3 Tax=Pseudotabrizicola sp. TaxID=2939647 RepID=UPI002730998B|nr:peptidylprolyl isomerase [Pseudotabrizicola sp.]MDP2080415.1 SurA N-terminal domain-containing protein [Pseudotabrizicola sp.]MDZ7573741.1 SurA N-terminal domain-containing protein [Pseudotabrizicola sp.]